jgi:hypothetical protein
MLVWVTIAWSVFPANDESRLFVMRYIDDMEATQARDQIPEMPGGSIKSTHSGQTNSPESGSSPNQ